MAFSQIIGHKKQREYLQKVLKKGNFAHAYVFSGPRHLGKMTVAKAFLHEVTGMDLSVNPDASVIEGDEKIPVEEIRQLRERLALSSFGGGKKIALIDGADQMTRAAQNALLKTLEEPRGDTMIILIAHQPDRLLETIRSRCAHIRFHPVSENQFPADLAFYAGRPGVGFLMKQEEERASLEEMTARAQAFLDGALWERIALIESWVKEKAELPLTQWEWLLHARMQSGDDHRAMTALLQLKDDLAANSNKQLALQHFARSL